MKRLIWTSEDKNYRIVEHVDLDASLDNLKGDCFNFEASGYTGTRERLRAEELAFEREVETEGVFGYVLERWDPTPDKGWVYVDACWGFVGQYDEADPNRAHYIVAELKGQVTK